MGAHRIERTSERPALTDSEPDLRTGTQPGPCKPVAPKRNSNRREAANVSGHDDTSRQRREVTCDVPFRQVRPQFDESTVRVYQAYSPEIADGAVGAQTFRPPFRRNRMTWIKPSFTWMMYRSGWATKPGQERVLAIDILRDGFDWALAHSSVSHFDRSMHSDIDDWKSVLERSPVRIQWDPERSIALEALPWRAIQIGLGGDAVLTSTGGS